MTRSTAFGLVLAAAGALGMAAGCGGASTSNSVVAPTGTLVTDTFSGTVQPGGVDFQHVHGYDRRHRQRDARVGGTASDHHHGPGRSAPQEPAPARCCPVPPRPRTAGTIAQLTGTLNAGSYCVEVLDVGNAAGPIAYTVTVAHT